MRSPDEARDLGRVRLDTEPERCDTLWSELADVALMFPRESKGWRSTIGIVGGRSGWMLDLMTVSESELMSSEFW